MSLKAFDITCSAAMSRGWTGTSDDASPCEAGQPAMDSCSLWDPEDALNDDVRCAGAMKPTVPGFYYPQQFYSHPLVGPEYLPQGLQDPGYMYSLLALLQGASPQQPPVLINNITDSPGGIAGPSVIAGCSPALPSPPTPNLMLPQVPSDLDGKPHLAHDTLALSEKSACRNRRLAACSDDEASSNDMHASDPDTSQESGDSAVEGKQRKPRRGAHSLNRPAHTSGKTASGQRKKVSEMSADELRRVRESNRITAKRNRAKVRREKECLQERLRQADEVHRQLSTALQTYQERRATLLALVGEKHKTLLEPAV